MRGAPGGRHVYADPHADTQAVVAVAFPFLQFFRLRLPDRPGVVSGVVRHEPDQHPEQDAVAVGLGFRLRFGFEFAVSVGIGADVDAEFVDAEFADGLVEFADGITAPDGLVLSVRAVILTVVVSQTSPSAPVSASLDAFIASSPSPSPAPARAAARAAARVRPARRPSPNCA